MSAARKTVYITLAVLVVLAVLCPVIYVQAGKRLYAHKVAAYLTHELHYSKQELASVQGKWTVKTPPFQVVVKFSDEPEVEYTYFAHNHVLQFSHSITPKGRRQGITDSQLKHYVPLE